MAISSRYLLIVLLIIYGCESTSSYNLDFVEKHNFENFEKFKNYCIYRRSKDEDGDNIYFINKTDDDCPSPYIVVVYDSSKTLKSTSKKLYKKTCEVNEKELINKVFEYIPYKVAFIQVDSYGNVFLNLRNADTPNLIKFANKKYKTAEYKQWHEIKDNWYEVDD